MPQQETLAVTRALAQFACDTRYETLPDAARVEAVRAFLNWVGCTLGGCQEAPVLKTLLTLDEFAGPAQAALIGHRRSTDMLTAATINCMSSGVHTYDDTHLKTVAHPGGPVASAIFAIAGRMPVSGTDFLAAFVVGLEVACRLSTALFVAPARCHLGFSMTGLTCGIGAAAAAGRLLGLDEDQMTWALGIAAIQSSGFRETHASDAAYLLCAQAARAGLLAAWLAKNKLDCSETSLEGSKGFAAVFGTPPNLSAAVDRLGSHFEMLDIAYKPYPCGIVVHPVIDVCLDAAEQLGARAATLERIELTVPTLTLTLAHQANPRTAFEAQISLYHWAAVALARRTAGIDEGRTQTVLDPQIAALRRKVTARADPALHSDEAKGVFHTADGERLEIHVAHCRGSVDRPMSDVDLDRKFMQQAGMVLASDQAEHLLAECRKLPAMADVGRLAARYFA